MALLFILRILKLLFMLQRGIFTISIDYEFAWGYADQALSRKELLLVQSEASITRRLLALLAQYDIKITWAIVGHLLEKSCEWQNNIVHPEYVRPVHTDDSNDWFVHHPSEGDYDNVLWYDSEHLIRKIEAEGHEIGSHSYAHVHYGASGTREESVRADLQNVRRIHAALEYPAKSFVFPRNYEGHHCLLREFGFIAYRGVTPRFYHVLPRPLQKPFHFISYLYPSAAAVMPRRTQNGLVNIPDSMLLFSRAGIRRVVPAALMKLKALRGLTKAAREKKVFHLWFHPSNFWHDTDAQFAILESILRNAADLRAKGLLDVQTMIEIALQVSD